MNTQKNGFNWASKKSWLQLIILAPLALMMVGCLKKCPVPMERQSSVSSTEWRLVESTDPDPDIQNNLSNFTFLVFRFGQDFSGDIKVVINNTQYDQPVRTFTFDVDPQSKMLLVKYAFVEGADSQASDNKNNQGDQPIYYYYSLGRQLELRSEQGHYYRFVPFTGILSPDDTCVF